MCEQTEIDYLDGDIVWVKLGSCWWPGEVVGSEKLPPDVLPSFRKPPIAVVKFFQEDTYEYVKSLSSIYKYNCSRKDEFINKGLYMYRTKHGHMEKFPEDVIRAETAVGGDIKILTRDEFQETKKESYAGLFGDPSKKSPGSAKKGKSGRGRLLDSAKLSTPMRKFKEKTNYKVHILVQGSKTLNQTTENASTPSTSRAGSEPLDVTEKTEENKSEHTDKQKTVPTLNTPTMSSSGVYACHACQFTTTRLNVLILHNKSHSVTFTPYTPSPVKKKNIKTPKSTPLTTKTYKQKKQRQEKTDKIPKKSQSHKRAAEPGSTPEVKKPKTDEEIKSSLLADWDDGDEESNDESAMVMAGSPEVPIAAESPAVPTPAELPSAQVPAELMLPEKKSDDLSEKPESSSDSKYEFCEDEDWPVEADIGRKIPRVKNPSKRKGETKSVSIDEDEMAREVAELLNKTTLPELPSAPEPLKVEENFPEPSIVKSPDKKQDNLQEQTSDEKKTLSDPLPPKTIFKTKTFFRSRHSRSQDAIGKYVAEQLNAAERMDIGDNEINGAEVVSSPEIRISPPVEHVKVARLAPKIQLKKMKAEAAQLRELEKFNEVKFKDDPTSNSTLTCVSESFTVNVSEHIVEKQKPENYIETEVNCSSKHFERTDNNISNLDNSRNEIDRIEEKIITRDTDENIDKEDKNNENKTLLESDSDNTKEEDDGPILKVSDDNLPKSYETFMNESTASAVDALLSVSRETDRVTKVISDDPPEDLFEDDNKDNNISSNVNGYNGDKDKVIGESNKETYNACNKEDATFQTIENANIHAKEENVNSSSKNIQNITNTSEFANTLDSDINKISTEGVMVGDLPSNDNSELISKTTCNILPIENTPSESDLQIAEALINLPTTTINKVSIKNHAESTLDTPLAETLIHNNKDLHLQKDENISESEISNSVNIAIQSDGLIESNNENINSRFETEQEKCENLNAAQSLVQMSETIDHNMKIPDIDLPNKELLKISVKVKEDELKVTSIESEQNTLSNDSKKDVVKIRKSPELDNNSSKLLRILEEPCLPKLTTAKKTITKQIIVPGKEKILNFDVGKSPIKSKPQSPKQKIIIRRTTPNKNLLNNITEVTTPDKIILSRTNKSGQDGSSIQTYTIQTTPESQSVVDTNTIIIQPKIRKITKPVSKLQKIKPHSTSLVAESKNVQVTKSKEEALFDINSMPIVISDDILTPESIEKMPIVMSDGNIITNSSNPPKLVKTKQTLVENEKVPINAVTSKAEMKTLLMNTNNEVSKVTTPNILSKSSKLRGAKPMLVIDKTTGKQKIIMTKTEPTIKEIKQPQTLIQPVPQNTPKTEKFIILPTTSSPRPARTQKIVIDPQTGKAHVLVGKGPETHTTIGENKPVSAKLVPSISGTSTPGNTVMIITNAEGAQSRIVLTPEHEKILFPNKQQPNVSQLKTFTQRITSNSGAVSKAVASSGSSTKTQTRIVPKQKSAIITSKGQLIVGGRIATTAQNIAPLPEIRPAPKRIIATEPKKLVQAIQKNSSEPLIFLKQKSGAVMQLTAAQFEHLQRTGQIIQKTPTPPQENKIIVQKSITISPNETIVPTLQKQRVRKQINESPMPTKKIKHEIAIAPAPISSMPALTPLSNTSAPPQVPNISSTTNNASASNYNDLDNFEELLPSTAIARQESVLTQPELSAQPSPAPLSDGQLLAVPGEHFGGPTGSFYLCVEENGTFTVIDNRPLVLENSQLVPMAEPLPVLAPQPERRDILEAALANSDVFHAESTRNEAPDFRDLNANVSVHCRVSETSTTLNQPIMTPVEVPSKGDSEPTVPSNLEDGLAVIGVTPQTVPTSLELPITVTDPRIAPKTTDPLSSNNYATSLLTSPNTEVTFTTAEADVPVVGPISMPLLTDEEAGGKSMPILTDEVTDRTVSSVESTVGSPSSIDVRESENEDSGQWPRRLLTPCSDTSETSAEIPLQPNMQLSVNDLSQNS